MCSALAYILRRPTDKVNIEVLERLKNWKQKYLGSVTGRFMLTRRIVLFMQNLARIIQEVLK
jgi:hypothetical protein